jgi:hypothetical protein
MTPQIPRTRYKYCNPRMQSQVLWPDDVMALLLCRTWRYKPYPMIRVHSPARGLRLCIAMLLLVYVFAGASLALPLAPPCARCATMSKTSSVTPGASCPLSSHGHHCHGDQEHTTGKIVVCPDGCMHHQSTGGEIPSPPKFISALDSGLATLLVVSELVPELYGPPRELFVASPYHPPSASR